MAGGLSGHCPCEEDSAGYTPLHYAARSGTDRCNIQFDVIYRVGRTRHLWGPFDTRFQVKTCRLSHFHYIISWNFILTPRGKDLSYFNFVTEAVIRISRCCIVSCYNFKKLLIVQLWLCLSWYWLSVLRSRSRWSWNYLEPVAGAEINFLINIFCIQFGGC